jgi:hypothetical protein
MNRVITVKGKADLFVKPDLIVINMDLESTDKEYKEALAKSDDAIAVLSSKLQKIGLDEEALRTVNYSIKTKYVNVKDSKNNYTREFEGYSCFHELKLEFGLDLVFLAKVLFAISDTKVNPEIRVNFSVKDKEQVSDQLLILASRNAKKNADILAKALGVRLGKLMSIEYAWGEIHLLSPTEYRLENKMMASEVSQFRANPEDISISDSVTCVWEIE